MVAAMHDNVNVCRALIKRGATVDRPCTNGTTALMMASEGGCLRAARLLLTVGGARIEHARADGVTPLFLACLNAHLGVAALLVERGACVRPPLRGGNSPLSAAVNKRHLGLARLLLDAGAGADVPRDDGATPLTFAAQNGDVAIAELLLDAGADVHHVVGGMKDSTPLFFACQNRHAAMVELLLDRGADVNHVNAEDNTPLGVAVSTYDRALCRLLVARGATLGRAEEAPEDPEGREARRELMAMLRAGVRKEEEEDGVQPSTTKRCHTCDAPRVRGFHTLEKCSGCREVYYCDRACQQADWKDHKQGCKLARQRAKATATAVTAEGS
jgi:hypothetical protein